MPITVSKFGGTSLCDADAVRRAIDIVCRDARRKAVVVSAPGKRHKDDLKVTDMLATWAEHEARPNHPIRSQILDRYREIAEGLHLPTSYVNDLADEIVANTNTLTKFDRKRMLTEFLMSRGEWLMAKLFARATGFQFVEAAALIRLSHEGTYLHHESAARAKAVALRDTALHLGIVVPGFYGSDPLERIRTLPRGGSDTTGAILAELLHAELYENWTDVPGFLAADPRVVLAPRKVDVMTYSELRELSFMGAHVLHTDAVRPVARAGIPTHIRCSLMPDAEGTTISSTIPPPSDIPLTAVAGKRGYRIVTLEKYGMDAEVGYLARAASVFASHDLSIHNCPGSVDSLSFLIEDTAGSIQYDQLVQDLRVACATDDIHISDEIGIICAVGRGLIHHRGAAAKITGALSNAGINIRTINQGSKETNIELGVSVVDLEASIRAIYAAFFKN